MRLRKLRFALRFISSTSSAATQGGVPSHPTAAVMSSRKPRALYASDTTRSAASSAVAHPRTYPATFQVELWSVSYVRMCMCTR